MRDKIVLSKGKIEELTKELKVLETKQKKELGKTLEQARLSDVSEDTDAVIAVMGDIEKIDLRINEVKDILKNAEVLDKKGCTIDKVQVGSEVKVKVGGKTVTFNIVSEVESDPSKGNISDKSPLGKALLKSKMGDTVKLQIDERKMEYEVLAVC
ncbi:MAG: GreA/GreB family elongation factor [Candidatus Dojkabacteria bacterium]